jgi:polygalacturonase
VTGCTFGTGHGLSIGSYTSGGLNGLTVTNCDFNGALSGIHGKSSRDRGGLVENLTYANLVMTNVTTPISFDDYYFETETTSDPAQPVTSTTPYWDNVTVTNLHATGASDPVHLWALPQAPISNFTMSGVTAAGSTQGVMYNATGVRVVDSTFSPTYQTYDAAITTTTGGPSISKSAAAASTTVTGKSVAIGVLSAGPAGESGLTYAWSSVGEAPAPVTFSATGTNAAKATTATFTKAGP